MTWILLGVLIGVAIAFAGSLLFRSYPDREHYTILAWWNAAAFVPPLVILFVNPAAVPIWALSWIPVSFILVVMNLWKLSRLPVWFDTTAPLRP